MNAAVNARLVLVAIGLGLIAVGSLPHGLSVKLEWLGVAFLAAAFFLT